MPSCKLQVRLIVTPAQHRALRTAAARCNLSVADFIRRAVTTAAADVGVQYPDDLPPHGDFSRARKRKQPTP